MEKKMIRFKSEGPNISLFLNDVEGIAQPKEFLLRAENNTPTAIPVNYAKDIFNMPGAMDLYKKGLLRIVDGEDVLMGQAKEEGIVVAPVATASVEQTRKLLQGGNITAIKKALEDSDRIDVILQVAQELGDNLTRGVITAIEDATNISLTVD